MRVPVACLIDRLGGTVAQCPSVSSQALQVPLLHLLPRPSLPGGYRLLWSQIYSLGADLVVPRFESAPRDDIDSDTKELLKILEQADMIKERGARFEVHQ